MENITAKQKAIQAIIDSDKEFLTPAEIAPVLGVDPHNIRLTARQQPELLKFEFIVLGNRTKIPRIPFLRYIGINVDNNMTLAKPEEKHSVFDNTSMTNEDLLLAIINELGSI